MRHQIGSIDVSVVERRDAFLNTGVVREARRTSIDTHTGGHHKILTCSTSNTLIFLTIGCTKRTMLHNLGRISFLDILVDCGQLTQICEDKSSCCWIGRIDDGDAFLLGTAELSGGWTGVTETSGWVVVGSDAGTAIGDVIGYYFPVEGCHVGRVR